ncbi:MAG: CCA tRNA nucleotidyltransferase [Candidatus Limnocylindria bacterium]
MEVRIPANVGKVIEQLRERGHEAYVVGGCVRDALRGVDPADWDVATGARPEEIQQVFRRSLYLNRFGTVVVRVDGTEVEVTTYRTESDYSDRRRPDIVAFTDSLRDDLSRRDFTMNAMAWTPSAPGADAGDGLVDPFGGRADLEAKIVRAVGVPDERFAEDALRMLRAVRFAAVLGFRIDPSTAEGVRRNAHLAKELSGERIQQEVLKIVRSPVPSVGFRMLSDLGLLEVLAPELERCRHTPQEKVAALDVFEHSLATLDAAAADMPRNVSEEDDLVLRLAALLHDVGKPDTYDDGHFHQHEFVGEAKARAILRRWKLPREVVERTTHLVRHHMFWYQPEWTSSAVRRFIRNVGLERIRDLFFLRRADNIGSGARVPRLRELEELWLRVEEEIQRANAFSKRDLAVNGNELMAALGIRPGPEVGRIADALFERVLDEPELNTRERLLELAREIHARSSRSSS